MTKQNSREGTVVVIASLLASIVLASVAVQIWSYFSHGPLFIHGDLVPQGELADLIGVWVGMLAGAFFFAFLSKTSLINLVGLRFKPIDAIFFIIGIACQILLVNILYFPFEKLIHGLTKQINQTAISETKLLSGAWLIILGFCIVLIAPIVEEIFFRGIVLHWAQDITGTKVKAALLSSALFAIMHFVPIEIPALFALGMILSYLQMRFNRLGPCIAVHVGFNFLAIVLVK
jgi:membrane protease YdiL (CAAX protease family)